MNLPMNNDNSRHRISTHRYTAGHVHNVLSSSNGQRWLQKTLRERIQESLPATIIGITLILSGTCVLFWNEGQAVHISRILDEGYNAVVRVTNLDELEEDNEGKLVHVWGTLSVLTPLQEPQYGIAVKAVKLKRRVQMYQWVEEESYFSSGDPGDIYDLSYTYTEMWKDKLIASSLFHDPWGHTNPDTILVPNLIQTAEDVKVGVYYLSPAIKETFSKFSSFAGDEPPETEDVKLHNGMYYLTNDLFNPEIGNIRIQFYFSGHDGELVTIIAQQVGNVLHPHITSSGRELLLIRPGKLAPEEMFSSEHAQNRLLTWVNRLAGWFLIFIGFTSVSSIIQYLVVLSPLLRDVIHLGLGSANLTLSMSLSLLLIGGAWCFYRPGLALFILLVATMPMVRALVFRRERRVS